MSAATSRILPRAFQSLRALRALNVASVGLALAAATAPVFAHVFSKDTMFGEFGVWVGVPTLILGVLWAMILRIRSTIGKSSIRWGWLASIPLAMLNGALACGLMFAGQGGHAAGKFGLGLVLGATVGAIFWIP